MKTPAIPSPTVKGATVASTLYATLRNDLLAGQHAPGEKLRLEPLMARYEVGQTPLREALNRLVADGLVERHDQRGFAVPAVSRDDLLEITETRCWLEEIALRQSIARATPAWEDALVVAEYRLARQPRLPERDHYRENPEWEAAHRALHETLLAGCGSRWLLGFCRTLADQWYRYRQLAVMRSLASRNIGHEHHDIVAAALAHDTETAVAALLAHYRRTAEILLYDATLWGQSPGAR